MRTRHEHEVRIEEIDLELAELRRKVVMKRSRDDMEEDDIDADEAGRDAKRAR